MREENKTHHCRQNVGQSAGKLEHDDDDGHGDAGDAAERTYEGLVSARGEVEEEKDERKTRRRSEKSVGTGSDAGFLRVARGEHTPCRMGSAGTRRGGEESASQDAERHSAFQDVFCLREVPEVRRSLERGKRTYRYSALTKIPTIRPKVAPTAIDGTKIPAGTLQPYETMTRQVRMTVARSRELTMRH